MRNILIVARKEIQEGLRNRWVLATTLLLAALALSLTFLGSAPTGNVGVRALDVVIVSLSSLTIFLLPLIALLISHDAIVGEMERGTMLLLLSYPVARWQVLLGKFVGSPVDPRLRDAAGLRRGRGRACWRRGGDRRGELDGVRLDDRLLDPARRRLHRRGLPRQRAGARARNGGRHRHRHLAGVRADLRHGPARAARGRPGAGRSRAASSMPCSCSTRPTPTACST